MLGQSRFSPAEFRNVAVTAFVSPDCSDEVFTSVIDNASREILLNVYEFSSPSMADALARARARGIDIQVLVEGGPVGGIAEEEKAALWRVNRSGIPVYAMVSSAAVHAPYRYDHAKYVVIDRRTVLIVSENFKYSGFAPEGITGNRGWGVVLTDPQVASYYASVFLTDMQGPSVMPYAGEPGRTETPPEEKHAMEFSPKTFDGATIFPVLAPDTSTRITDLIDSADQSIDIEEAYITNETRFTLNPYLSAAINASRRGVRVRVLLDSYWYNVDGKNDNDEMAALINRIGADENLPLEARCAELRENQIEKIHNKGSDCRREMGACQQHQLEQQLSPFQSRGGCHHRPPRDCRVFHGGIRRRLEPRRQITGGKGRLPPDRRGCAGSCGPAGILVPSQEKVSPCSVVPAGTREMWSEKRDRSEFHFCTLAYVAEVDVALTGDYGQRPAVDHEIQFRGYLDLACTPLPADVLGDCRPGDAKSSCRITLAQSLLLYQSDDHLGPHRRQEVSDHGIAVHQGTGMFRHTYACRGLAACAVLFW